MCQVHLILTGMNNILVAFVRTEKQSHSSWTQVGFTITLSICCVNLWVSVQVTNTWNTKTWITTGTSFWKIHHIIYIKYIKWNKFKLLKNFTLNINHNQLMTRSLKCKMAKSLRRTAKSFILQYIARIWVVLDICSFNKMLQMIQWWPFPVLHFNNTDLEDIHLWAK